VALAYETELLGAATGKRTIFEVSFVAGLLTVTATVPALAMFALGTTAVTCDLETNVVVSGVPFQSTVAPETKLVP
jgi:hypothetical protein